MVGPLEVAEGFAPVLAGVLVASVWQGLALTMAAAMCLALVRRATAAARSVVWTAVLLSVVVLPALAIAVPHGGSYLSGTAHLGRGWGVAFAGLWAALSVYRAALLGMNGVRLYGVARRAVPVSAGAGLAPLLVASRKAILCVSAEVNRPSLVGFVRPRILLPPGLLQSLSRAEMEQVVLHEMEHLRRCDDWWNLLQQVSLVLLPLNPALLWLDRRLCRERELACDDGVLRRTRACTTYAACLVKLAEDSMLRRGVSLALSALGTRARRSELTGRVTRILAGRAGSDEGKQRFFAVPVLAGTAVLAGLLAHAPQAVRFDAVSRAVKESEVPVVSPSGGRGMSSPQVGSPGPMLVKAMVDRPAPHLRRSASGDRRRPTLRVVRTFRDRVPVVAELPAWSTAQARMPTVVPTPRVVLTRFERSEPVYAAVPFQGGWLIVQL